MLICPFAASRERPDLVSETVHDGTSKSENRAVPCTVMPHRFSRNPLRSAC